MKEPEFNNLVKIIENLIQEETRGQRFFADAAAFVKDPRAIELFQRLSLQEIEHREKLESVRRNIVRNRSTLIDSGVRTRRIEYDGGEIPIIFVHAESETRIDPPTLNLFKAEEFKKLLEHCTVREIIRLSMRIEFDNFGFLIEAAKARFDAAGRKIFLALADEEKQHYLWLKKYLEEHRDSGGDRISN